MKIFVPCKTKEEAESFISKDCDFVIDSADNPEEFLLVGADKMKYRHLVAEIACDDSKNFTVPTINSQDYGYIEGIEYNLNYQDNLIIEVSYLNKNATDLSNRRYYLALSTSTIGSTLENIVWDNACLCHCQSVLSKENEMMNRHIRVCSFQRLMKCHHS